MESNISTLSIKVELPDILDRIQIDKINVDPNDVIIIKFSEEEIQYDQLNKIYDVINQVWFPNNKVLCMSTKFDILTIPKEELERLLEE